MVKSMALKGSSGGSLGAYETSPEWRKKKREKNKRFEDYCKRKSGPVRTRKLHSLEDSENCLEDTSKGSIN